MKKISRAETSFIVILSFLLLLLTGEAFGGPYVMFYYYGLFSGILYSVLALLGLILLTTAGLFNQNKVLGRALSVTAGTLLLVISFIDFSSRGRLHQQSSITGQIIPMVALVLFGLFALFSIYVNLVRSFGRKSKGILDGVQRE
jgi:hypothetical protein